MKISLNIILDALSDYNIEPFTVDAGREFDRVDALPQDGSKLHPDRLYVGRLSDALQMTRSYADVVFFALRDRYNRIDETELLMKNIVVVNENITLTFLLSTVLDIYINVANWRWNMQNAYIKNKPMQELLILSEHILGNFISISDSSLTLITYTPNITTDEPISLALIENGYHNEDAIKFFKDRNRFELWEKTEGLLIGDEQISAQYTVVSKIFKYGGTYFTHVVMVCNNHPVTQGLLDLYNILLENLSLYIDRDWQQKQHGSRVYDPLITNILDNPELPTDVIADRVEQLGLPLDAHYCMLKLLPLKVPGQPAGIIAPEIQELLPDAKVVVYHQSLLILIHARDGKIKDKLNACQNTLLITLQTKGFYCGVSTIISNPKYIREAFNHATLALNYGRRLVSPEPHNAFNGPFFAYEDYYTYMLMLEQDNKDILMTGEPYKWLMKLRDYDTQHNMNNYDVLYKYLIHERNAADTAEATFMSRNNLVYRINRIKEMLGIDFDDYLVRMKIIITYEMIKLLESN